MYDFLFLPMLPPQIKSKACDGHGCQFRSLGSVVREDCFPPSSAALWLQSLLPDLASCDWLLDTHLHPALKIGKWVRYTRVAGKRREWFGREDLDSYIPSPPPPFLNWKWLTVLSHFISSYFLGVSNFLSCFSSGFQVLENVCVWLWAVCQLLISTVFRVWTIRLTDWTVAVCPLLGLWLLLSLLPAWSSYITFKKTKLQSVLPPGFFWTSLSLE